MRARSTTIDNDSIAKITDLSDRRNDDYERSGSREDRVLKQRISDNQ